MNHFILKCDDCRWHSQIDEACIASPCPNCGRDNLFNLVNGTIDELKDYLIKFNPNNIPDTGWVD